MRIRDLSIDGFGIFHEHELRELPGGLVVLTGDNESGKSTLLAFVHTVLFGFPDKRTNERHYPPLRGGTPGGRLVLVSAAEGVVTIERKDGARGGPVTVSFEDGRTEGDAALRHLLGGTTRSLYRNLYGFSLTELQQMEPLNDDEVRDVIYGASLGTAAGALPAARKALDGRLDDIYKPGGQKPEINMALKDFEAVRTNLRDAQSGIRDFEELSRLINERAVEIEKLTVELRGRRERLAHVETLCKVWDDWITLRDAETGLAKLPEGAGDFPDNGSTRLEDLIRARDEAKAEHEQAKNDLAEAMTELESIEADESFLKLAAGAHDLALELAAYQKTSDDVVETRAGIHDEKKRVTSLLTELGSGWDLERAAAIDRSVSAIETIDRFERKLEDARRSDERAADALRTAEASCKRASEDERKVRDRVKSIEILDLEIDPAALKIIRDGKIEFVGLVRDLPRRASEAKAITETLEKALREISPSWTREDLESFDCSIAAQQKIEHFEDRHAKDQGTLDNLESELKRVKRQDASFDQELGDLQTRLDKLEAPSEDRAALLARRTAVRDLSDLMGEKAALDARSQAWKDARRTIGTGKFRVETQPDLRRILLIAGLILMGLGAVAGGLLLWLGQAIGAAIGSGLCFVLGLGSLAMRSKLAPSAETTAGDSTQDIDVTDPTSELAARSSKLTEQITVLLNQAGLESDSNRFPSAGILRRSLDEIDQLLAALDERTRISADVTRISGLKEKTHDEQGALSGATDAARAKREQGLEEWTAHVSAIGLPADLSPRTARLVFGKVESAKAHAQQARDREDRVQGIHRAIGSYAESARRIPQLLEAAQREPQFLVEALDALFAKVKAGEESAQALAGERGSLQLAVKNTQVCEKDREKAAGIAEDATAQLAETGKDWETWLKERSIDDKWSPPTARRALELATDLAERSETLESLKEKLHRGETAQGEYQERFRGILESLGRTFPPEDELPSAVRNLERERVDQEKLYNEREALTRELVKPKRRLEQRKQKLGEVEQDLRDLLAEIGTDDVEIAHTRAASYTRYKETSATIENLSKRIRLVAGVSDLKDVREELSATSREALGAEAEELTDANEPDQERLKQAGRDQATNEYQRAELYSENRVAELRSEQEGISHRLHQLTREWARHRLAKHLMEVAKERFEKAHQPEVIKQASHHFATITGGAYTRVFSPHGEARIEVITPEGKRKGTEELSRGTAEQLYLAIRFGFIATPHTDREALPILMDDVLVNFDPRRAKRAAEAVAEMAHTHQVLFFTCHPATAKIFTRLDSGVPVKIIEMSAT